MLSLSQSSPLFSFSMLSLSQSFSFSLFMLTGVAPLTPSFHGSFKRQAARLMSWANETRADISRCN
jgi:hypothetical protein